MNLKPLTGASSRSSIKNILFTLPCYGFGRTFAALKLQTYVNEVIRRPGACVLERELAFVLCSNLFHLLVKLRLALALNQKRRVHNHPVAYGLVRARSDGSVSQDRIDLAYVRVGLVRE